MRIYQHIIRNISLVFLIAFQQHALAQSLTADQVKELQGLHTTPGTFEVFVLYNDEHNPTEIRVLVGVDYNLINNSEVKSLKRLMSTFAKVYIPTHDSVTIIGKELVKDQAHSCLVRDSGWLVVAHLNWGLPTLVCGCAAVLGSVTTYNSPTTSRIILTLVASYLTYDFYRMWSYSTAKARARIMAAAMMEEKSTTKVLAIMDKTSARFAIRKLSKNATYKLVNVLDEEETKSSLDMAPKKRLKRIRTDEPQVELAPQPEKQKSEAELALEAEANKVRWEELRQERIKAEEEDRRAERIRQEWQKRQNYRN